MKLSKDEIKEAMAQNGVAWDNQDLEGVLELYHDDVFFENWTGGYARGKKALREAWTPWFTSGGDFRFNRDDLFIDEDEQKLTVTWELEWPSTEKGYEGKLNTNRRDNNSDRTANTNRRYGISPLGFIRLQRLPYTAQC